MTDEETAHLARLKKWLQANMRELQLPELLVEVDNDLGFTRSVGDWQLTRDTQRDALAVLVNAISGLDTSL